MAITAPVHADVLPVAPSIDDPDNFDAEADAFAAAQRPFGIQMNALGDNVYANALAVQSLAGAADANAQAAATSAGQAASSKSAALQAAQDAGAAAQAAADSATAAANASTSLTASSSSAVVLGNGAKVFTVPAGKQFPAGELLQFVSSGTPAARMFGTVASYAGTTLTATITQTEGPAGTYNDWTIAPGGARGPIGGTAGGQLTGALDELKGTAPASSATPDIWNAGGNYVPITQTANITGLPNAPQAGAKRTLKAESTFSVVSSANFYVHGGSTVINPGDELDVVADTASKFLVTVRRNNGAFQGVTGRVIQVLKQSVVWTAPVTGWYTIILIGAAGSGAVAIASSGARAAASGGSTGGMVIKTFFAVAGDTYTLALGAKGLGVTNTTVGNVAKNGNDATDSTFIGGSVSLTAGGGKKGNAAVGTTNSTVATGAAGGTASGGDFNFPGSASGSATVTLTAGAVNANAATGGAAVPYKGVANKSGDVVVSTNGTGGVQGASGGAGIGGKSGNVTVFGDASASAGASALAPSADATSSIGAAPVLDDFVSVLAAVPLQLLGAGTNAATNSASQSPGAGGGSGGVFTSPGTNANSGGAVMLGGTGGVTGYASSSGMTLISGSVIYGGASGGVSLSSNVNSSATLTSGDGGAAFAIIVSP
ncbi:hypothetical protein FHW58_003399 [Duganella sp. 1224]|uniref:hypothetical protein n=1 Tax=Duganella sp. 1224 TaxID=2587052 RepID=UPI0015CE6637|nr:hypothetical protein [Duganella sp. 1224]NYE62184.1 hypothetical protein [Duganella sp. 1224]